MVKDKIKTAILGLADNEGVLAGAVANTENFEIVAVIILAIAFEAFLELAPEDHPDIESVRSDLAALDEAAIPEALRAAEKPGPLE